MNEAVANNTLQKPAISNHTLIVAMLYSAFLILSNLIASKIIVVFGLNVTAALVFFPITYIFDDILTEVYGFKVSRRVIWMGFVANAVVTFGGLIATSLPSASFWHGEHAYELVFSTSLRIFIASSLAYLTGEFINSTLLAKLKVATQGRHLWLRALSSSAVGVGFDTVIFSTVGFYGKMPTQDLTHMMVIMYLFKVGYEVVALPFTYKIVNYLKRIDNIDYYDTKTKFNPFSLKID